MTWIAGDKYLQRRKRGKWRHWIWNYDMDCRRKIPPETKKRKIYDMDCRRKMPPETKKRKMEALDLEL